MASVARSDLPSYRDLIYPVLRAVASLGGSAQGSEIIEALIESLGVTPEQLAVTVTGQVPNWPVWSGSGGNPGLPFGEHDEGVEEAEVVLGRGR